MTITTNLFKKHLENYFLTNKNYIEKKTELKGLKKLPISYKAIKHYSGEIAADCLTQKISKLSQNLEKLNAEKITRSECIESVQALYTWLQAYADINLPKAQKSDVDVFRNSVRVSCAVKNGIINRNIRYENAIKDTLFIISYAICAELPIVENSDIEKLLKRSARITVKANKAAENAANVKATKKIAGKSKRKKSDKKLIA